MPYHVRVNVFEGPYDLLLFLIKKGEINIYDIPIAKITKEYLEYIELMRSLDLEIAGEFIVMAATLMRIKSRMLLPVYIEQEEEIEDPRRELVQNLLEYQRIKNAVEQLEQYENRRLLEYPRGTALERDGNNAVNEYEMQMSVYELVIAFHTVMTQRKEEKIRVVQPEPATIEEKMDEILILLESHKRISFKHHFKQLKNTFLIIINFLAILELARKRLIRISQSLPFKDIWIYKYTRQTEKLNT